MPQLNERQKKELVKMRIDYVLREYHVTNAACVDYLRANPLLSEQLLKGAEAARKYLGKNIEIELSAGYDAIKNRDGLFAIIRTELSPEKASNRLSKFYAEWIINQPASYRKSISHGLGPKRKNI